MSLDADVKPITYLKNHTAELVDGVHTEGRSVVVTQKGEAKVVIMDVRTYDRWRDALAVLQLAAQGEADVRGGRTVTQAQAFARAEAVLRRARGRG